MLNTALREKFKSGVALLRARLRMGATVEIGVYLVAFFLPLYVFKIDFWGLPLNFFEVFVYLLFLVWFSRSGFKEAEKIFSEIKENRMFAAGLILFFSGVLISTILSDDLRASAGILKGWFIAPFLLFLIVKSEIKTENQVKNVFRALSFSGAAVSLIALFYFFFGRLTFDGRLAAFYLSPNHLAMFLAPILILAAGVVSISRDLREKILSARISVLALASIYLTYSYGAWLAICGAAIFGLFFSKIEKRKKIMLFFAFFVLTSALLFWQSGGEKIQNLLGERSSFASRVMIWKSAFLILKDNWFFGIGPGMFQTYYLEYQKYFPPYLEWAVPQPHNLFLAFWLQTGVLGFLGFILILAAFLKEKTAVLKSGGSFFRNYNFWLILAMLAILIHGLIDTPYFKNDLSALFWIILAL